MSLLLDLQSMVAARLEELREDADLPTLEVLTERRDDLSFQIQRRIQKVGYGLTVITPEVGPGDSEGELAVGVTVAWIERPLSKVGDLGIGKTASEMFELCYGKLWLWQPAEQVWSPLRFRNWGLTDVNLDDQRLVYTSEWETRTFAQIEE